MFAGFFSSRVPVILAVALLNSRTAIAGTTRILLGNGGTKFWIPK